MDAPNSSHVCLENLPTDIWANVVLSLPVDQLGRLKLTGSKHLWYRLLHPNVFKCVKLQFPDCPFLSWPMFLNEFPSIDELAIISHCKETYAQFGLTMRAVPPTLRKFEIRGQVGEMRSFFHEGLNLDEKLPCLETFDLNCYDGPEDFDWLARAPPTLTKLRIGSWYGDALPPSLIHFEVSFVYVEHSGARAVLPTGLQTLIIGHFDFLVPLPPHLTELQMDCVRDHSEWSVLPDSLEKLKIMVSNSDGTTVAQHSLDPMARECRDLRAFPVELLPRSLTDLEFVDLGRSLLDLPSDFVSVSHTLFPLHLKTLNATNVFLSPNAAKYLPASLSHLSIDNLCERVCKYLPRGLISLRANRTLMSPNLITFLPKSLSTLHLWLADASSDWFDYENGAKIQFISQIPEFMVHKDFRTYGDWHDSRSLPPHLTSLQLSGFSDIGDSFTQHQSLSSLRHLNLHSATDLTNDAIPLLSHVLTNLNLFSSKNITSKCFHLLPRSLTHLDLTSSSSVFDAEIQHLPRNLRVVYLHNAVHLTDQCARDFPRYLETLRISKNKNLTPQCVMDLPSPLLYSEVFQPFNVSKWRIVHGKVLSN